MNLPKVLLFGSIRKDYDPWGDWFWELAADLQTHGWEPVPIAPRKLGARPTNLIEPFHHHSFSGFLFGKASSPNQEFPDLFRAKNEEIELKRFLLEKKTKENIQAAIIHRWQGFPLILPKLLSEVGIPTILLLADAWPLCPRRKLVDRQRKRCQEIQESFCANCIGETWKQRLSPDRFPTKGFFGEEVAGKTAMTISLHQRTLEEMMRCEIILTPNQRVQRILQSQGLHKSRIAPLHFQPPAFLPRCETQPGKRTGLPRIGFLGDLDPTGGLDILIHAFLRLPPKKAALRVWGSVRSYFGDLRFPGDVFSLLRPDLDFAFLGPLPSSPEKETHERHERPDRKLERSKSWDRIAEEIDLLVCPESFGDPTLEIPRRMMERGIPVIAADDSEITPWIDPGKNGAIYPTGDADELRRVLGEALNRLGKKGFKAPEFLENQAPPPGERLIELLYRIHPPLGVPPGTSFWAPDLSRRVLLEGLPGESDGGFLHILEWGEQGWEPSCPPRQLMGEEALGKSLDALLFGGPAL
jgi:glycosyltransferase involved in cell wall biosynthesis